MAHKNCNLGTVQAQDDGWGFVVLNEHSKPLVALTYETQAEADDTSGLMAKVIILAAITPFG
jgi:hypothetical protein